MFCALIHSKSIESIEINQYFFSYSLYKKKPVTVKLLKISKFNKTISFSYRQRTARSGCLEIKAEEPRFIDKLVFCSTKYSSLSLLKIQL